MGNVTVVGFINEDEEVEFIRRITEATLDSLLTLHADQEKSGDAPVVRVCRFQSPRRQFGVKADAYAAVYGLTVAAVKMCEEENLSLRVIGDLDEMPVEVSYDLEAHYLHKEKQNQ